MKEAKNSEHLNPEGSWKKIREVELLQGLRRDLGIIRNPSIRKTEIYTNDSLIKISNGADIDELTIGVQNRSLIEFVEILFTFHNERGKDQFFFDEKTGMHSFFHTGVFWPTKDYSACNPQILPFLKELVKNDEGLSANLNSILNMLTLKEQ